MRLIIFASFLLLSGVLGLALLMSFALGGPVDIFVIIMIVIFVIMIIIAIILAIIALTQRSRNYRC